MEIIITLKTILYLLTFIFIFLPLELNYFFSLLTVGVIISLLIYLIIKNKKNYIPFKDILSIFYTDIILLIFIIILSILLSKIGFNTNSSDLGSFVLNIFNCFINISLSILCILYNLIRFLFFRKKE